MIIDYGLEVNGVATIIIVGFEVGSGPGEQRRLRKYYIYARMSHIS